MCGIMLRVMPYIKDKPMRNDAQPSPCEVCQYGKMSAECRGCPHNGPQTWGEIFMMCAFVIVLAVLLGVAAAAL